jgi:DnaJ-domain-containing protein 1
MLEALFAFGYGVFRAWWDSSLQPQPVGHEGPPPKKQTFTRRPPAWWKVLQVRPDATIDEIKQAYRKMMARTHPDKVNHLSDRLRQVAEREAKKINAAYEAALKEPSRNA